MMNVVMLEVVMLNGIMLSIVMLDVIMLNVFVPRAALSMCPSVCAITCCPLSTSIAVGMCGCKKLGTDTGIDNGFGDSF